MIDWLTWLIFKCFVEARRTLLNGFYKWRRSRLVWYENLASMLLCIHVWSLFMSFAWHGCLVIVTRFADLAFDLIIGWFACHIVHKTLHWNILKHCMKHWRDVGRRTNTSSITIPMNQINQWFVNLTDRTFASYLSEPRCKHIQNLTLQPRLRMIARTSFWWLGALTEPMTFEVSQREWEGVHFIVDDVYQWHASKYSIMILFICSRKSGRGEWQKGHECLPGFYKRALGAMWLSVDLLWAACHWNWSVERCANCLLGPRQIPWLHSNSIWCSRALGESCRHLRAVAGQWKGRKP